ncbi:hypothetical protein I546_1095 [Mycobacterium kansasii 732]|nr:hypothetical protein I546_1095 [Mycobacterium kansasii 732]
MDGVRDVGGGDAVDAELSVQERDLVPQLTVFVLEFANAFVGECEALPQRGDRIRARFGQVPTRPSPVWRSVGGVGRAVRSGRRAMSGRRRHGRRSA